MSKIPRRYSYSWIIKAPAYLFGVILIALSLFLIVGLIHSLVYLPPGSNLIDVTFLIMTLGSMAVVMSCFAAYAANLYSDIQVVAGGLKIQTFCFLWVYVPWGDIEDIKVPLIMFSRSRLVIVRKLTFLHRFVGFTGGVFFQPAFFVSPKMIGYNELVMIIREKIGHI